MALTNAAQYWYPQVVAVGFGLYMGCGPTRSPPLNGPLSRRLVHGAG